MLTRRQIRIKVMQSVYAFSHSEKGNVDEQLRFFEKSIFDCIELLLLQWGLFKALHQFLEAQIKSLNKNYLPQANVVSSFEALLNNNFFQFIVNHPVLNKKLEQHKLNDWEIEFKSVQRVWQEIQESQVLLAYCKIANPSPTAQHQLLIDLFEKHIAPAEHLHNYYEDRVLTWQDDLPMVNTYMLKTLKKINPSEIGSLSFPQKSEWKEELSFGTSLLEKTLTNAEALQKELEGKTPNWDADRIAMLDALLLKIAIAELLYFSEIPPKVTLNEFLEIAKEYSTPKSNTFINGVLDKLMKEFTEKNRLHKSGRGLQ